MRFKPHHHIVASAQPPNSRQMLFARYFMAIVTDLVVLNLFAEHWDRVHVAGFTISLITAVLLQLLLQVTLVAEHAVDVWFEKFQGFFSKVLKVLCAWIILFGSKFIMLGAISFFLGDAVHFEGPMHGAGPFIWMIVAMLAAEELVTRVHRSLS